MTAVASPVRALAPGDKLDRYELLCPLADGGMASVWAARQIGKHGFEKLVAIKTILPKFAADIRFQEMFLDEARIASRIEHLNVAHILDLGEERRILYLVMDYVDGDALSKLARVCQRERITIPTGVVLRVLADTCAGLHEAHEMRDGRGKPLDIVHRDVSPHNVLVSTRGVAKLIDFGIAKARSRVGMETHAGVVKGKIQYMAPEQALGRPVDRRADVWAVGAVLYQLLAGKPPYQADNQLQTLQLLGSGRPPLPLPPGVPPAIGRIVRKALAHSRDHRYPTAAELGGAIEDVLVEVRMPTTAADVAAFCAEHLGEHAERRRQEIDLALAAADERRRVVDALGPTSEWGSVVVPAPPVGPRPILPLPSGATPGHEAITLRDGSLSRIRPRDTSAPRRTRGSIVPGAPSSATPGSAAIDASGPMPLRSRSGKSVVAGVALVAATAAAGGTGLSWTMGRSAARPAVAPTPPALAQGMRLAQTTLPPAALGRGGIDPAPPPPSAGPLAAAPPAGRDNRSTTVAPGVLRWAPRLRSALPAGTAPPPRVAPGPPPTEVDDGF